MKIVYTDHLEFRLKIRSIPYNLPREVFHGSKEHYYDLATRHYLAIKKVEFAGKAREMVVTYDKKKYAVELITIHPIRPYQKHGRVNSGRWRKI